MKPPTANRRPDAPAWGVAGGILLFSCCLGVAAAEALDPSKLPPPAEGPIDFNQDIRPILESSCLRCHGPERPKSRFRLDNRQGALKGGANGVDIVPGASPSSPLVYYAARLVPEMEMPPPGKGEPLTTNQVGLLRAWVDQGAAWATNAPTNSFALTIAPALGGTRVSGNTQKFRELYWQKEGLNGGLERFEMSENISPETKYAVSGHVLENDYKVDLSIDRNDLGYIHSGWDEYRKYYNDTGGYYPASNSPSIFNDGRDLYLDIGKAWIEFGLTLPRWPQMKLGYEYDYKKGEESTLDWGAVTASSQRNIVPAAENLDEGVQVIKFDLDQEIEGGALEERFRGEFYNLKTQYTNLDARGAALEEVREENSYFQGANTLRLEKRFNDWFFGSAGFLYSKLNSDGSFMDTASNGIPKSPIIVDLVPEITLEQDSQVLNLNGLLGPFAGLSLSAGVEEQWMHQRDFGGTNAVLNPVYTNGLNTLTPAVIAAVPTLLSSDYAQNTVTESLALRYSAIPFTALFVEARLQQQTISQYDDDLQHATGFTQDTYFSSQLSDVRAGFNTSPWRSVSLSAHYRRYEDDSHYNNDPGLPPPAGYPGFILARVLLTDEVETKLTWHPWSWLKTALSYQYLDTHYTTDTDPIAAGISPGSDILAGRDVSRIYSINGTITPCPRLYLSGTFSYQPSISTSAYNGVPYVAPYRGAIYSASANGTYALGQKSEVFANYSFSEADYAQTNFSAGLPLGIEYRQWTLTAGLARRFGKNITARLQYGYDFYAEPSSGTVNNFSARSIFGTLTCKLP